MNKYVVWHDTDWTVVSADTMEEAVELFRNGGIDAEDTYFDASDNEGEPIYATFMGEVKVWK